jgi:small subunit ribosomal protein S5
MNLFPRLTRLAALRRPPIPVPSVRTAPTYIRWSSTEVEDDSLDVTYSYSPPKKPASDSDGAVLEVDQATAEALKAASEDPNLANATMEPVQLYPNFLEFNSLYDSYTTHDTYVDGYKLGTTLINDPPVFSTEPRLQNRKKTKIEATQGEKEPGDGGALGGANEGVGEVRGKERQITEFDEPTTELHNEVDEWIRQPPDPDMLEKDHDPTESLPINPRVADDLMRFPLVRRRVVHQTGKGKIASQYILMVVGNGKGLVGFGEGKHERAQLALEQAFNEACKNMDYVDMFEGRTLWSNLSTKLGSTQILMRPRPLGFGLRCGPFMHQVCKAAGIKDVSGKVWGSRNGMQIVKATCRVLHGGHAPLSFGDGVGGPGKRLESGFGMRGREAIQWERGRKLHDDRLW